MVSEDGPPRKFPKKLRRALKLSLSQWLGVFRATAELALARIQLTSKTPAALLAMAGKRGQLCEKPDHGFDVTVMVDHVSWAISAAAGNVPWRSDCFVQAMAAQRWLNRAGIASELFIGVRKQEPTQFEAHAWLRHADKTVTGGDFSGYVPLAGPETWNNLKSAPK